MFFDYSDTPRSAWCIGLTMKLQQLRYSQMPTEKAINFITTETKALVKFALYETVQTSNKNCMRKRTFNFEIY